MKALRPEEQWAKEVVGRVLATPVEQYDDGSSPSMYDLRIMYAGREGAALEVTSAADAQSVELWNLVNDPRKGRWQDPRLRGGWLVVLRASARARQLFQDLPLLLLELEKLGLKETRGSSFDDLADRLDVVHASQSGSGTEYPGSIYPTIEPDSERSGGWVVPTGDPLAEWIGDFLRDAERTDVLRKLGRSDARERHAFVVVPGFPTAPFAVIDLLMRDDAPPPTARPRLPREVTDVWIASTWSSRIGFRWSRPTGWLSFDKWAERV